MKQIKLFDTELIVKDHLCSENPNIEVKSNPSLRLYIKLTDSCNADCLFCANKGYEDFGNLDLKKLDFVIRYLLSKNLLHGISITGGEPMMNPEKLNNLINLIYDIDCNLEVQVSTNGYNLKQFKDFENVNRLESIHISRHHYDDNINYEIFKTKDVASTEDIIFLQQFLDDKKIININTMVMKNYIDSLKEIKKMLDYTGNIGIYKNGFVSLMKCNDYCIKNFINFNNIFNNLDENFFKGHHFYSKEYCECIDGIYLTSNFQLVEYYARMVKECNCPHVNQLVYTSDNKLKSGFNGKILYK